MTTYKIDIPGLRKQADKVHAENKTFLMRLKKKNPKYLDQVVHKLHDEVFEEIDCMDCASCCKSISPVVTDKDVARLSKFLKQKPSDVIKQYLYMDNDNDYVFKETPCPFLMDDNYCMVYESRPKACREYPHTDRKKFIQLLTVSLKNTHYCPAVYEVVDRLKKDKTL